MTEDSIVGLVLPQAATAREGVQVLGGLLQQVGAAEGMGVLIADAGEAWYLETASGHHWLAQRVPADSFFVSANQVGSGTAEVLFGWGEDDGQVGEVFVLPIRWVLGAKL